MPNFSVHLRHGIIVGAGLDSIKQLIQMANDPNRKFEWGELLLCTGIGAVAVSAPDILEPATSPNHRHFFHSILFGASILYAAHGPHTRNMTPQAKNILHATAWSYFVHLLADWRTPKGLPIC